MTILYDQLESDFQYDLRETCIGNLLTVLLTDHCNQLEEKRLS